ncbi:MAG: hypothetical protein DRI61_05940 [Chloroflexi bacterium]|nr:MAG: hypothetical protein DRI61_05940 [Chloroflexota bacterium]
MIDRLDPKIRDLVMGLQRIGIRTELSCQGHFKRGFPYPWVDSDLRDWPKLFKVVAWYNLQVHDRRTRSKVVWVIMPRPFFKLVRLMPDVRNFSLRELQRSAVEFGRMLRKLRGVPELKW